ncbi:putative uncharacterized protein DDB_G0291608 [Teleopsis dalmanni]|uniref:putative uncharacterized protein DDB_G0291608 n=1 Tax=Teleopsis dalmanni TaxID=139649 RepID=UPI0018CD0D69|nr:putative uncharacterized protein DDB_G0291608 [Teleopsis dalmanni]
MSRKDDPVFNVKFVQLIEKQPCLWNSTLPAYSKKDETERAWQEIASETKYSVRNCREKWRTIRSSFLRSLKPSRTSTGRGKRKYYLFKYLQFLVPYTKTRTKATSTNIVAGRKTSAPPMTQIQNMPLPLVSSEETKDSISSDVAIAEDDVVVALHEETTQEQESISQTQLQSQLEAQLQSQPVQQQQQQPQQQVQQVQQTCQRPQPPEKLQLRTLHRPHAQPRQPQQMAVIKMEEDFVNVEQRRCPDISNAQNISSIPIEPERPRSSAIDLTEFAEFIKSKYEPHNRREVLPQSPDADQSFLNSLLPYMKEMTGKKNLRFKQDVLALIYRILEGDE